MFFTYRLLTDISIFLLATTILFFVAAVSYRKKNKSLKASLKRERRANARPREGTERPSFQVHQGRGVREMSGDEEATVVNDQPHSVKINSTKNGEKSWEVKVYASTPEEAEAKAKVIDKSLEDHYRK